MNESVYAVVRDDAGTPVFNWRYGLGVQASKPGDSYFFKVYHRPSNNFALVHMIITAQKH
jgi:hypothetical protein